MKVMRISEDVYKISQENGYTYTVEEIDQMIRKLSKVNNFANGQEIYGCLLNECEEFTKEDDILINLHKTYTEPIVVKTEFYVLPNGKKPVERFILNLEPKMQQKVLRAIGLLETRGDKLRKPESSFLGDGIYELRIKFSSNKTRVLYFFVFGSRAIFTNGFTKKTQKPPPKEIKRAKKYMNDFHNRRR